MLLLICGTNVGPLLRPREQDTAASTGDLHGVTRMSTTWSPPNEELDVSTPSDRSPDDSTTGPGWRPHLAKAVNDPATNPYVGAATGEGLGPDYGYSAASGYEAQSSFPTGPGRLAPQGYQGQLGQQAPHGYGANQGYQGYPAYAPPVATNGLAVASLVASIIGWTAIPFLASIAAVVLGHMAQAQIRRTGEQGAGLATAGLIIGYAGIVLQGLGIVLLIVLFSAALYA